MVVGGESWHRALPSDWVPIIARDIQRQAEQGDQVIKDILAKNTNLIFKFKFKFTIQFISVPYACITITINGFVIQLW
jgi:hypothetical protein